MRWLLFIFLVLLFTPKTFGQRGVVRYSKENGLISNVANDLTFDAKGFLWIATNNGIDRFDGQRFIHFTHDPDDAKTICSNSVERIVFDQKGSVWAGTKNGGLIQINTATLQVHNFFHSQKKESIADNQTTAFEVDNQGELWMSPLGRGLDHFLAQSKQFKNYKPSDQFSKFEVQSANRFYAILQDNIDGDVLWCASDIGLFAFDKRGKSWKHFPITNQNLLEQISLNGNENKLRSLEQDGKGNLYIGTEGGGMLYFDQFQAVYRTFLLPEMNQNGLLSSISSIKWRDNRYLYICIEGRDFELFDTKTKFFIRYDQVESAILKPKYLARFKSQIAVCSQEKGVFIHNESLIFGERSHLSNYLVSMAVDEKNDCTARLIKETRFKLVLLKSNNEQPYKTVDLPKEEVFQQLISAKEGGFWLLSKDKLYRCSLTGKLTKIGRFSDWSRNGNEVQLTAFLESNQNVWWIGTKNHGLFTWDAAAKKIVSVVPVKSNDRSGFSHYSSILALCQSNNHIYIGCQEGLAAYDLTTKRVYIPVFAASIPRDQITALAKDNSGLLWVGSQSNGVFVISFQKNKVVHRFTARMGLQTPEIRQLVIDAKQRVWIKNDRCIALITRNPFMIRSLEEQNGMSNVCSILSTSKKLYFVENKGFINSSWNDLLPVSIAPVPYIQRVRELNTNGQMYVRNKHVFDYESNNLVFEFGVLDYSNSANNFVSYRLKGLDNEWQSGNGKDEAAYYNLPGGTYEFEVRLVEDGKIITARYPFTVFRPFWLRWWFILLVILAIGVSVWMYIRLRIKRIENTERMRAVFNAQINEMESKALRAQMNPHFLFNSLNSIRLFILKNEVESASDYIAKFSKLLRMILNHSRQDMITVYDEIQSLKLYMEFERLRFDAGFEFDIQIDGQEVLDSQIPPMIIQPFVENAIWHGLMPRMDDKGYIKVSFLKQAGRLYVTVEDNGIGREKARVNNRKKTLKEGSVGLQITKDRLRSLSMRTNRLNDFEIEDLITESGQPKGTLVTLYFENQEKP